jgi:GH18 family chitinase
VDANGNLADKQGGMWTFKGLRNSYPSVKLLFSIGGATYGPDGVFKSIAESSSRRQTFANNILNYVQSNNLHGGKHLTHLLDDITSNLFVNFS